MAPLRAGATQEEQILGPVVEEDADVEGPVLADPTHPRRPGGRLLHDLAPGPGGVAEEKAGVIIVEPVLLIALEEAKAPYTTQRVDLKGGEQRSPNTSRSVTRAGCRRWPPTAAS